MRDRPFTKSLKKKTLRVLVTSRIDRVSGWTRNSSWMDAKFFLKNPAGLLASRIDRVSG
jgi:hypothetical protein